MAGRALLAFMLFVSIGCAAAQRTAATRERSVGMQRRAFVDSTRSRWDGTGPRPVTTLVWYPAGGAVAAETLAIGPPNDPLFLVGAVSGGAPIEGIGRLPLVVLSHGTGGSGLQMAWLGTELARAGFIAAAVNHHGNTGAEPPFDARGFLSWWERARDLSTVITRLLADPELGPRIDATRIAAAGFSLGGYTVLSAAGARTSLALHQSFCESPERDFTCEGQPEFPSAPAEFQRLLANRDSAAVASMARAEQPHRDPRVRAAIVLSPAVVRALTAESLRNLAVPLLVVAAERDRIAPAATNARYVHANVPGSKLLPVPNADHYVFLDACTARGKQLIPAFCVDSGVVRARVHEAVVREAVAFLREALKP